MSSTRIAQNTQVSSERAKKGEITLNDICLLLVIGQNITLYTNIQASNPGTLTTLLFSHVRTCQLLFSLWASLTLHELRSIHDSMNLPKIEFIS